MENNYQWIEEIKNVLDIIQEHILERDLIEEY